MLATPSGRADLAVASEGVIRIYPASIVDPRPAAASVPAQPLASPQTVPTARIGLSLAPTPDLDGDGAEDLLAASFAAGTPQRVYAVSSADGATVRVVDPEGTSGEAYDYVPSIAAVGTSDLVVTSPFNSGRDALVLVGDDGSVAVRIPGDTDDRRPWTVERPSDGRFLIGFPFADIDPEDGINNIDAAGRVRVYDASGSPTGSVTGPSRVGTRDSRLSSHFGLSLAALPDFDGDGTDEFVIGAPLQEIDGTIVGAAYVVSGADLSTRHTLLGPASAPGDRFGCTLAVAPDMDDDGTPDVAVAACDETVEGLVQAGRVYVFSGATGVLVRTS